MIKRNGHRHGTRKGLSRTARGVALAVSALLASSSVRGATTNTWTGAVNTSWDTGGNWSNGSEPGTSEAITFSGVIPGTGSTITLTAGELGSLLTFNNSYTLTGGSLALSNGTINVSSGSTATIASALTGSGGITKADTGSLTLSGTNLYSGTTTVSAGTLTVGSANALGTGSLVVGASGSLVINAAASVANVTNSGSITINSTKSLFFSSGSNTFTQSAGSLTVNGQLNLNGNTFNFNGGSVTGTVTMAGASTLNMNAAVNGSGTFDFTGTSGILSGNVGTTQTLLLHPSGGSPMSFSNASSFTNSGIITLAGAGTESVTLTVGGGSSTMRNVGTLNFNAGSGAAGRTFSGTLLNSSGANVNLNESALFNAITNSGSITIASGKTLSFGSSSHAFTQSAGTLTINGAYVGNGNAFNYNGGSVVGTVTMGGSPTLTIGASAGNSGTFDFVSNSGILSGNVLSGQTLLLHPSTGAPMSFSNASAFTNSGTITLGGATTESVTLSVGGGSSTLTNIGTLNFNAGTTTAGRTFSGTLLNNAGANVNLHENVLFNTITNAGNITIDVGKTLSFSSSSFNFTQQAGSTLTINGAFTGNGNAFNYNGGSVVGTVTMGGSSTLTIGASAGGSGTFDFTGSGGILSGNVLSGQTLLLHPSGGSPMSFSNASSFTNSGTITLAGAGTEGITLSVAGGSGTLTNIGTLNFNVGGGAAGRTFSGTLLNNSGASVNVNESTLFNNVTNSGSITIASGKTVTFGSSSFAFTQSAGTLTVNGAYVGNGNNFNYNGGSVVGTVTMGGSSTLTIGASAGGSGTFDFTSSGGILNGNVASGQALLLHPSGGSPMSFSNASSFTNSGAITLAGATSEGVTLSVGGGSGTMTNIGTLNFNPGTVAAGRTFSGTLLNTGTGSINVNESTVFNDVTNSGSITIAAGKTLTFGSSGNVFTSLSGGTLTVGAGANVVTTAGGASGGLVLSGNIINLASSATTPGTLTLGGNVTAGGTANGPQILSTGVAAVPGTINFGAATRTFTINDGTSAIDLEIGARITNGSITKSGLGTLLLSGSNTYTGGTILNAGVLRVSGGNAIPDTANVTVGGTSTFAVDTSETVGSVTGASTIQINSGATLSVGTSGNTTFSGNFSGSGSLLKQGSGVMSWGGSNSNTLSGSTIVNAGTLKFLTANRLTSATALELNGGTVDLNGINQGAKWISGTSGTITSATAATLTLNMPGGGSNPVYAGNITGAVSLAVFSTDASDTLTLNAQQSYTGTTTITTGGIYIGVSDALPTATNLTMGASSHLNLGGNNQTVASLSGSGALVLSTGTLTINQSTSTTFTGQINYLGNLIKAGSGTLTLGGVVSTTTTGTIGVTGGVLQMNKSGANAVLGTLLADNGGTARWIASNQVDNAAAMVVNSGGTLDLNGQTDTVGTISGAGTLALGSGAITIAANSGSSTFSGVISGTGTVTKSALGVMVLDGSSPNTYTGLTTVSGGTLVLNKTAGVNAVGGNVTVANGGHLDWLADEQISDSATLTLNSGGALNLAGHVETVGSFVDGGGTIVYGGGTLLINGAGLSLGNGTVISSNLSINGDVTYVGNATAATLSGTITLTGAVASHIFTVNDGAANPDLLVSGVITGTTGFTKAGAGTMRITAVNTMDAGVIVRAGTLEQTAGKLTPTTFFIGNDSGETATFTQAGGTVTSSGNITLGNNLGSSGTYNLNGGTLSMPSESALVVGKSGSGRLNISATGSLVSTNANDTLIGWSNLGEVNQTGGSASFAGTVKVAYDAATVGSYTMSAGSLDAGGEIIGYGGAGAFSQYGGTHDVDGTLIVASQTGSSGVFSISGGQTTISADLKVGAFNGTGTANVDGGSVGASAVYVGPATAGNSAAGSFSQTAGTLSTDLGMYVSAANTNGSGVYNISGGTASLVGGLIVGGNGTINQTGGTITTFGDVGDNSLRIAGHYNLSDATGDAQLSNNDTASVGFGLVGTFVHTGGTFDTSTLRVGDTAPGAYTLNRGDLAIGDKLVVGESESGAFTQNGGTITVIGSETIGYAGDATFTQTGGQHQITGDLSMAQFFGHTATFNLSDGAVTADGVDIGVGSTGVMNITGGSMEVAGVFRVRTTGSSIVNFSGGTLSAASLDTNDTPARFNWTGGTLVLGSMLGVNDSAAKPLGGVLALNASMALVTTGLDVEGNAGGQGIVTVSGGSLDTGGGITKLGYDSARHGDLTVTGSGSVATLGQIYVGGSGTGGLQIASGGVVVSGDEVDVGAVSGGVGSVDLTGTQSSLAATGLYLGGTSSGAGGSGALSVGSGSQVNISGPLKILTGGSSMTVNGAAIATSVQIDAGTNNVNAGGVLVVGAGGASVKGTLTLASSASAPGTMILNGDVSFAGASGTGSIATTSVPAGSRAGTVDLNAGTRTITVADGSAADDLSIGARIVDGGIIKTGAGRLVLSGDNQYAGPTVLSQGVIKLGANNAIPASSAVILASGTTLELNGFSTSVGSLADSVGSDTVALGGGTLAAGGDNTSTTYLGDISGTGGVTKEGTGTWTLGGNLNYNGVTTINAGTVRLTGNNASLQGSVIVTGTGAAYGTLAMASDNLGSATLTLAGGHIANEAMFTISRGITMAAGGGTFDVPAGAQVLTLGGAVTGSAGGLSKAGGGTLVLANSANTYGGQTVISAGILQTQTANVIPSTSALTIGAAGTLLMQNQSQTVGSLSGAGTVTLGSGNLASGGNDATTVYAGSISGSGAIIKNGLGTLTLNGALTHSGGVTANAGTVALNGTGSWSGGATANTGATISIAGVSSLGISANIVNLNGGALQVAASPGTLNSGNPINVTTAGTLDVAEGVTFVQTGGLTGSGQFTKSGAGTLRMNASPSLAGGLTESGGTFSLGGTASLTNVTSVSLTSGGTLDLDNSTTNNSDRVPVVPITMAGGNVRMSGPASTLGQEFFGALTLSSGASSITLTQGTGGSTLMVFNSINASAAGGSLDVTAPGAGLTNKLQFSSGQATGFMGGFATINGEFAKYDPFQGVIPLDPGQYSSTFTAGSHVRLTNDATASGSMWIATLTLDTSGNAVTATINSADTLTITGGGIIKNGSSAGTITGGKVTSSNGRLDVRAFGAGAPALTFATGITGSLDLIKGGDGIVTLSASGANHDFAGNVYLNAGTLRISADGNLGASSNGLIFNGGTLNTTASITLGTSRGVQLNAGGGAIDVGSNTLILAGANQLAGSGPLTKSGSGVLRLSAANNYNGTLNVGAGTVELANAGALGNGTSGRSKIVLSPDAILNLRADGPTTAQFGNDVTVLNNAAGHPAIINTGPATSGTAPGFVLGNLRIGDGTLRNEGASGSLTFSGIVTLAGNAIFDAQKPLTLADRVTGTGSLTVAGNSTVTLGSGVLDSAANTYTGDTIIAGGTLRLDKKAGTIAIPGNIVMSGGTLSMVRDNQIADTSTMSIGGGTLSFNADQAVRTVNNTGGVITVVNSNVTAGDSTLGGGSFTISTDPGGSLPVPSDPSGFDPAGIIGTVTSTYTTDILNVNDGANTVNPGGLLNVGSGGLFFGGSTNPAITFVGNLTSPGQMVLTGDITNNCTTGTAQLLSTGTTTLAGTISFNDISRTINVSSIGSDLKISTKITAGGIRKSGVGKLILTQKNDYKLGTVIASGTLEAYDGALGTGPVTLQNATLNLRSDAATSAFGNDVVSATSTINIDRITAGTVGTFQLNRLSIGAGNRLIVRGNNGGTLEFTGAVSLAGPTAIIDNTVPVVISNSITGTSNLTKDTGAGTLTFGGNAANTYVGSTTVNAGVLQMNKPAGTNAVGGSVEAAVSGTVRWLANDQVPDTAQVSVNGSGALVDLNGKSDTVGSIDMTGGTLSTGAGTLKVLGDVTTHASTANASITGKVDLGSTIHTFTVEDGPAVNDLQVSADVSGQGGGISKSGGGKLVLTGNNTFTGGVNVLAGTLETAGASSYSGQAAISVAAGTLDVPGAFTTAAGAVVTKAGAGALTIRGTQTHGVGAQLLVQDGAVNLNTDAGSTSTRTLNLNITGGNAVFNAQQHLKSLSLGTNVNVTVTPGTSGLIYTDTLAMGTGAKLNVADGSLIVSNGTLGNWSGSGYTGIRGQVISGNSGGAWNGSGIVTTQSKASSSVMLTTLAVASAAELGISTYAGQSVSSSAVLVRYTYFGDANLNGSIDGDDYFRIDQNVSRSGSVFGFASGDFDGNGKINADDYFLIDRNYARQASLPANIVAPLPVGTASVSELSGVSAVPEPASALALLGFGATLFQRRRRRV